MTRRGRPRAPATPGGSRRPSGIGATLLLGVLSAAAASCGLPDDGRVQVVPDESVPYGLLAPGDAGSSAPADGATVPRDEPVVFWLQSDGRLAPQPLDLTCDQADVVEDLLLALDDGPSSAQRESGVSSGIPTATSLALIGIEDGVARVGLDPLTIGDPERLPLAVGQVVLTVTSAPGVDAVALVASGETVDLPLPDGALAPGAATADDYAVLLPPRLGGDGSLPADLGCP